MDSDQYVWLIWSSAFLVPWIALFLSFPAHRRAMLWASAFTAPFGLTEPLFVPEYWSPPSLFDLAARTGFDIESVIFCFAIGGVAAVLVDVVSGRERSPVRPETHDHARHRFHRLALAVPFVLFPALLLFDWNAIYPGIVAMYAGAAATVACRPDLTGKTLLGSVLFLAFYLIYLTGLEVTAPGYIVRVWNLDALTGVLIGFVPLEEVLFATAFGAYWAGVYEHFTWRRPVS